MSRRTARRSAALLLTGLGLWTLAACDALRLEPPAGSGGTTSNGGNGGAGGDISCQSNDDCPPEASVCDTAAGSCVQCAQTSDCAPFAGTVCNQGSCVCPTTGDTWCGPDNCVDTSTSSDDCGSCEHACFGACVDGACADPWEPISLVGAPSPRSQHVSVWANDRLIVWGGTSAAGAGDNLNTGGIYDPATSTWTPTSIVNAPSPRQGATAVWTGSAMIVWGGRDGMVLHGDGASFDPATNIWTALPTVAAPSPREGHTAVWTGAQMLVWGGAANNQLGDGAVHTPGALWEPMGMPLAPAATRTDHSAVWDPDGGRMLVYGGFGDGPMLANIYLPGDTVVGGLSLSPPSTWGMLDAAGEPPSRARHSAVWADGEMWIFGGTNGAATYDDGFRYVNNIWSALAGGTPPEAREQHTAVWLDDVDKMIIWGGIGVNGHLNSGGVYDKTAVSWDADPLPTALEARVQHTAVSDGSRMYVWGGSNAAGIRLNSGAVYTP